MKKKDTGIQLTDSFDAGVLWDLKIIPQRDESEMITSGFVRSQTLSQNMACLLAFFPGEVKTQPTIGVGLPAELLNEDMLGTRHRIRTVFPKDGLRIKKLNLYDIKKVEIDAEYE